MVTNYRFTNPRVKFDHLYFHAGDWQDIERYILLNLRISDVQSKKNRTDFTLDHTLFNNYNFDAVYNTLNYLFYHMKKGIYVRIEDNRLSFVPFSNANYRNPNFARLYLNANDRKLLNALKFEIKDKRGKDKENINKIRAQLNTNLQDFETKKSVSRKLDNDRQRWLSNNCNIRNFASGNVEGDINHGVFRDLLEELCKTRSLPNCEFFMNVRDFPVLHKSFLEPYDDLFDDIHHKAYIPREYQKQMCPILSCSKKNCHADVLMVNADDWRNVSDSFYVDWKDGCNKKTQHTEELGFKERKGQVIFRGSATGCGLDIANNIRLKAAMLGHQHSDVLDVGITDWNARPKKAKDKQVDILDPSKFPFGLKPKITDEEKFKFKYILHLRGHVSAYRLGGELNSGSVVMIPDSEYTQWFSALLEPYKHYIPVKKDLSNLLDMVKWCESNVHECENIARNAKQFYQTHLTKEGILSYTENLINGLASLRTSDDFVSKEPRDNTFAIITIFRDDEKKSRSTQRQHFIEIMQKLFDGYNYKIYIIEQTDGDPFNIGKLKNIGFDFARSQTQYDHYIFTDIDMIPDTKLMKYYLTQPPKNSPISLAMDGTRYHSRTEFIRNRNKNVKPFIGGSCSFTEEQFSTINGYPNNIYGWGGEDDELSYRMNMKGFSIGYPREGSIIDLEEFNDRLISNPKEKVQQHLKDDEKEQMRWEKNNTCFTLGNENGVNNLFYTVLSTQQISAHVEQITVDIDKIVDEAMFPQWFPTSYMTTNEVAAYKQKCRNIQWNVKVV